MLVVRWCLPYFLFAFLSFFAGFFPSCFFFSFLFFGFFWGVWSCLIPLVLSFLLHDWECISRCSHPLLASPNIDDNLFHHHVGWAYETTGVWVFMPGCGDLILSVIFS